MNLKEAKRKVKKVIGKRVRKCYQASEAIYHLVGGKKAGLKPKSMMHEGISHWYLETSDGIVVDVTVDQFETKPDYSHGCGRGFLTKKPSKRAKQLIEIVLGT